MSVCVFVCLLFMTGASHAAFEKLNIHFGNGRRTGINNVDASFYFASEIFCPLLRKIEPLPPDVAPLFHNGQCKYLRALALTEAKCVT